MASIKPYAYLIGDDTYEDHILIYRLSAMAPSIHSKSEDPEEGRVQGKAPVNAAAETKREAPKVNSKESLSAYFTIAAAAFGLVSDGCSSSLVLPCRAFLNFAQTRTI